VIKSRRRWAGHVACNRRGAYRVLVGNLREGDSLEDSGIDGRIILKLMFEKWDGGHGLDRSGVGEGQVAVSFMCGNEPLGAIKCWEFCN
jgi:hypothetical protein